MADNIIVTAADFDRWMDDYIAHPELYSQSWAEILRYIHESEGEEPHTYGQRCIAFLSWLKEQPSNG